MRIYFVLFLLILMIGIGYQSLYPNPNLLEMVFMGYSINMSMTLAITCVGALVVGVMFLIKFVENIINLAKYLYLRLLGREPEHARSLFLTALRLMNASNYARAEKFFMKAFNAADDQMLCYLYAAKCAQKQNKHAARDHYIQKCFKKFPQNSELISFEYAKLLYSIENYSEAAKILSVMDSQKLKLVNVQDFFRLQAKVLDKIDNKQELHDLLPKIIKYRALDAEQLQQLQVNIYSEQLKLSAQDSLIALNNTWKSLSRNLRNNVALILVYVKLLYEFAQYEQVEKLLNELIKSQLNLQAIELYGQTPSKNPAKQLALLESIVNLVQDKQLINLALARICVRLELWGQAKDYFRASIRIKPTLEALAEAAKLFTALGDETGKHRLLEENL